MVGTQEMFLDGLRMGIGKDRLGYKARYLEEPSGEGWGEEICLERCCPSADMRKYGPDLKQ